MIKLGSNSIGKIYFGSNSIGKAYYGSNLVFQKGSQPQPVMIPYIRGGGDGSYIDTGITAGSDTKVIVWARNFNQGIDNNFLFGARTASNALLFDLPILRYANTGTFNYDFGSSSVHKTDAWPYFSHYHKYELSADGLYVDNTQLVAGSSETFSTSVNIHLFGYNANGVNSGSSLPADISACKIYKGGVLVRDYTPVNSPSLGLYDAVSDTVFTNAGTGSFTYGTFNPDAYTPLEYITTSGSSYLLTPAIGSYSLPIVIKFRPTSTSANWFSPVGGRDVTGGTNRCEVYTGNTTYSNARIGAALVGTSENLYSTTTAGAVRNKDIIVVKGNNTFTAYYNNAILGSALTISASSSFSTGIPLAVGATWVDNTSSCVSWFVGNIYYVGLGNYNLVPAKVSGAAGMYDTYNDTFYPSTTSTPFTAGPEF